MLPEPSPECPPCPRLASFRWQNRQQFKDYHNGPVPSFGAIDSRLLVVGLAPGLHGANATGRPFTGDFAGDVLYPALAAHGFAAGNYGAKLNDGFRLKECRITNAARCVPPENKPTPEEVRTCRRFLEHEIRAMPKLRVILALGTISHQSVCSTLGMSMSALPFLHGVAHPVHWQGRDLVLLDSYHTSRYNVNTKRLSHEMFDAVVAQARALVDGKA